MFGAFTISFFFGMGFGSDGFFPMSFPPMIIFGVWGVGIILMTYVFLWLLIGKEVIEVDHQSIRISRNVLFIRIPRSYAVEYIQNLRVDSALTQRDLLGWSRALHVWGLSGGILAFDYGASTVKMGSGIDEPEARQILAEVQQHDPRYQAKLNPA